MNQLPQVFIGSSSEGKDVARAIERNIHEVSDTTLWMNGAFRPGVSFLQSLLSALDTFDFAVLVLTPDDILESRDASYSSPRDNVIFELGLFMGRIGPRRTFFVAEENEALRLPSDLSGISRLDYRRRENLIAAVSPACTDLIDEIKKQGRLRTESERPLQSRAGLDNPTSKAESDLRVVARQFFTSSHEERNRAAEQVRKLARLVPLDRILFLSDSVLPGERVAAAIALATHLEMDPTLAANDQVRAAVGRGLDDSRSRVRYRYLQFLPLAPDLGAIFEEGIENMFRDDSNAAVRSAASVALRAVRTGRD